MSLSIEHVVKNWPFRPMSIGWEEPEWMAVRDCKTLEDLVPIARKTIDRFGRPAALVSGPISTGGFLIPGTDQADIPANLAFFNKVVEQLLNNGAAVFNQMPFENIFVPINRAWKAEHPNEYCMPLLEEFYQGVFEYDLLQGIILIPGWQSSFGANWEVSTIRSLNKKIVHLPEVLREVLA